MTDPTHRPPVGTDLAPCPDCGADLTATVGEDTDGQWWDLDCTGPLDPKGCGWCAYEVEDLAPFTLAGAPWARALWGEVERLRLELAELRLDLAAEQGRQEGIARAAYILGAKAAHEDTVEGRYNCDPGYDWDCDPRILDDAKDNAEAADVARPRRGTPGPLSLPVPAAMPPE